MKCIFFSLFFTLIPITAFARIPHYFISACDDTYAHSLLKLIESLEKFDPFFEELSIFDLGLSDDSKRTLSRPKTKILPFCSKNPDALSTFIVRINGRKAKGWYLWKPQVLARGLELYPYFLYIDAGMIVKRPLDLIFERIEKEGYFFVGCNQSIDSIMTLTQKNFLTPSNAVCSCEGISAGLQGISRAISSYVAQMETLSGNTVLFQDDGTAGKGFGYARHDQPIFSILVRSHAFEVLPFSGGFLRIGSERIPFSLFYFIEFRGNHLNASSP